MVNEKRLIDPYDLTIHLAKKNAKHPLQYDDVLAVIADEKRIEAVVLPCKIGDDVYIIPSKANYDLNILSRLEKNNRVYHQKVADIVFTQDCWYARGNADKQYGTGRVLLGIFYKKTWFLTQEEAETALAKMDGGNENA